LVLVCVVRWLGSNGWVGVFLAASGFGGLLGFGWVYRLGGRAGVFGGVVGLGGVFGFLRVGGLGRGRSFSLRRLG
jgi:hypothetical protein